MELSSFTPLLSGMQRGELQLSSGQSFVVGSSSYGLDLNLTNTSNTLRATHMESGQIQVQHILSLPNHYKIDSSITAAVVPSTSKTDGVKIVFDKTARPFNDIGKTEKPETTEVFPMVVHKSIHAMFPPEPQVTNLGKKRPAPLEIKSENNNDRRKASRFTSEQQLLEFQPQSDNGPSRADSLNTSPPA
ncbi:hypothetical protein DL770_001747 [Monosporascus sp. CRB-9-2]|nr:hypothetical protein DL770_001747 [Monosporascus sp. CRB-9-2]